MRYQLIAFLLIFGVFSFCSSGIAQETDMLFFGQPALITPVGQSADGLMVNVLCRQSKIAVVYNGFANTDTLRAYLAGEIEMPVSARRYGPIKSLILVPGGSTKGLGAAKIDEKWEMDRVNNLIAGARELEMPIAVCHIGGVARRGSLSDPFNQIAAEVADVIIVVQGGDDDNFFKDIAEVRGVPYHLVENMPDIGDVLWEYFREK